MNTFLWIFFAEIFIKDSISFIFENAMFASLTNEQYFDLENKQAPMPAVCWIAQLSGSTNYKHVTHGLLIYLLIPQDDNLLIHNQSNPIQVW